jgi:HD-GYP domain-containing protein (c-di-GMP phosphodiesterase class II)
MLSASGQVKDARIIAVADVYDALTSARAYREAWTTERTLAQIQSESGTKLDARCVEALLKVYRKAPTGVQVRTIIE